MEKEQKIWHTKAWKEASKGKKKEECEWCGSKENLCLHHEKNYTTMIKFFTEVVVLEQIFRETKNIPKTAEDWEKYISEIILNSNIVENYLKKYSTLKEKAQKLAKERYFSLEGAITLCKKCHHAWHKGRILCPYCKEKYYFPRIYDSCSKCKEKIKSGEKWKERKELFKRKTTEENKIYREKIKKIIEKYPNAYQPWDKEEERILSNLFEKNFSTEEVAKILKRQPSAIWARLKKMKKVDNLPEDTSLSYKFNS